MNPVIRISTLVAVLLLSVLPLRAEKEKEPDQQRDRVVAVPVKKEIAKSGWNVGLMPAFNYSTDLGFSFGALAQVFHYDDGSDYPLYRHKFMVTTMTQDGFISTQKKVSPMLVNPAFLGVILTALAVGDYFWEKWLGGRFREENPSITFYSDRKSVTLSVNDIAYIESNDTEVHVVTLDGKSYRNKTGINQREHLVGEPFLRIHRSYLINANRAILSTSDCVLVSGKELPVSRKYKDTVRTAFET